MAGETREALIEAAQRVVDDATHATTEDRRYSGIKQLRAALDAARRDPEPVASADAACICWIDGFPRGDRHQSECVAFSDGWDAAIEAAIRGTEAVDVEARRLLGYLWMATGKNHLRPVHDLFAPDDPIVADIERLAIFPGVER